MKEKIMGLFSLLGGKPLTAETALRGRPERPYSVPARHAVLDAPLAGPWPEGTEVMYLAMGCFWGAEELYWAQPGVVGTAVGYMGGFTPNPTYEETCTARTGHAETVLVAYDPKITTPEALLKLFWEKHDPTQGDRQGNDMGSQYRSALYWTTPGQESAARASRETYQKALDQFRLGPITTELRPAGEAGEFYLAEAYHQQYLHKNPHGYRCHADTGIAYPG
jgi:peptide-methionine (S)-S-oxide reductase